MRNASCSLKFCLVAALLFSANNLVADILVTTDGMTLNGKVVENRHDEYVVFVNSYGRFTIMHSQIKELHITGSFREDIDLAEKKGLAVDAAEYEENYRKGEQARRESTAPAESAQGDSGRYIFGGILLSKNIGSLEKAIPLSYSAFAGLALPLTHPITVKAAIDGIEGGLNLLHSFSGDRMILGFSLYAGPVWSFPMNIFSPEMQFQIVPAFGAGWYHIKNDTDSTEAYKADISLQAGPMFRFDNFMIASRAKIIYISDAAAPFYSIGINIAGGYRF